MGGRCSRKANVSIDPRLLDVHSALDALPRLPLGHEQKSTPEQARATGTKTYGPSFVALPAAANPDQPVQTKFTSVKTKSPDLRLAGADRFDIDGDRHRNGR
jgi:hypothetical protein